MLRGFRTYVVLCFAALGWALVCIAFAGGDSAEKSRGLFLVCVVTIIRCDGKGEVVKLDPAQHPCLITLLFAA